MNIIHVSVAIIKDNQDRYLISKRWQTPHPHGTWEFPGGKQEPNETLLDCLIREIQEEVDGTYTAITEPRFTDPSTGKYLGREEPGHAKQNYMKYPNSGGVYYLNTQITYT